MVVSWVEYGAMVVRSAAYGATACSAGPTAITPAMAAWLAAIVARILRPLAPPPAAWTAWAVSAGGIAAGFPPEGNPDARRWLGARDGPVYAVATGIPRFWLGPAGRVRD